MSDCKSTVFVMYKIIQWNNSTSITSVNFFIKISNDSTTWTIFSVIFKVESDRWFIYPLFLETFYYEIQIFSKFSLLIKFNFTAATKKFNLLHTLVQKKRISVIHSFLNQIIDSMGNYFTFFHIKTSFFIKNPIWWTLLEKLKLSFSNFALPSTWK